ncbi:MAG: ParM/StbA family protein [Burkholderiaceae bacterium]|nr:ParM/StbA family protein [Sulfuritalea sp.]MCF8175216.1 ParM/StbA family protein [Burkholderiaceae bacterium]MCF8183366.1 ParM/StbA family protein [Polynucleobacter sp.]
MYPSISLSWLWFVHGWALVWRRASFDAVPREIRLISGFFDKPCFQIGDNVATWIRHLFFFPEIPFMNSPVVRAVDVGYGHVKYTEGRNQRGGIVFSSFPSQSIAAPKDSGLNSGALLKMDTVIVPVKDGDNTVRIVVGKDVGGVLQPDTEGTILDQSFCLSTAYAARLFGALHYMYGGLPVVDGVKTIDLLALGLPLNTMRQFHKSLAEKFMGLFAIDENGGEVRIRNCIVYPQPLGSYATFVAERKIRTSPEVLVVDPGFNTVDWFNCKGMKVNPNAHGAVERGVSHVIRAVVNELPDSIRKDGSIAAISRCVDDSLTTGKPFKLRGKAYDLTPYMIAGQSIINEAATAVKNSIKGGVHIEHIVVTGGGAPLFMPAIREKFPDHDVVMLDNPAFGNVCGFHALAENMARSANRATGGK